MKTKHDRKPFVERRRRPDMRRLTEWVAGMKAVIDGGEPKSEAGGQTPGGAPSDLRPPASEPQARLPYADPE